MLMQKSNDGLTEALELLPVDVLDVFKSLVVDGKVSALTRKALDVAFLTVELRVKRLRAAIVIHDMNEAGRQGSALSWSRQSKNGVLNLDFEWKKVRDPFYHARGIAKDNNVGVLQDSKFKTSKSSYELLQAEKFELQILVSLTRNIERKSTHKALGKATHNPLLHLIRLARKELRRSDLHRCVYTSKLRDKIVTNDVAFFMGDTEANDVVVGCMHIK